MSDDEQYEEPSRVHILDEYVNELSGDGWDADLSGALCVGENPLFWDLDFYHYINEPFAQKSGWAMHEVVEREGPGSAVLRVGRDKFGTSTDSYAKRLCSGCPVIPDCAKQALLPVAGYSQRGVIRAGVPLRTGNDGELGAVTRSRLEAAMSSGVSGG